MLAPTAQLWETSPQVTRELYLKSLSHDPSAAGKQGCQHNDDFILPAELLHWDYPPSSVPLAGAGSPIRQNNKLSATGLGEGAVPASASMRCWAKRSRSRTPGFMRGAKPQVKWVQQPQLPPLHTLSPSKSKINTAHMLAAFL